MRMANVSAFVICLLWSAAATAPVDAQAAEAPRRPNILLIMADQMRGQAMGVAGNPDLLTPNLDRLAECGVYLPNTFANTPVCCPARANLLTGQYPHRHGMKINDLRLREEVVTLAEILGDAGYRTGFIGKWHLDGGLRLPGFVPPGPRRQGFQFWAANECRHAHWDNWYFRDAPQRIPIEGFETATWFDVAIEFLRETGDQPFFLELTMGPPHNPYIAPEETAGMYNPAELTMRPNWQEGTRHGSRENIAASYAMITDIDRHVGRLMDALDELGLSDDTIVLFTADHGDMLGSHGMAFKRKPWEESIRVPGIVRYPRRLEGGRVDELLFSHVDFAPTMLGFAGLPVPEEMQGRDLSAALAGTSEERPEAVCLSNYMPYQRGTIRAWRGVRTSRYTYARWEDGPWVLYDVKNDPYELDNLVGRPEHRQLEQRLDALLARTMAETGDSWDSNIDRETILYHRSAVYDVESLRDGR